MAPSILCLYLLSEIIKNGDADRPKDALQLTDVFSNFD